MRFTIYTLMSILSLPITAFAADGHASVSGFLWRVLVFVVFSGIMYYVMKDRIPASLGKSVSDVKATISNAQKSCDDAKEELAKYARQMEEMTKKLEDMKLNARNSAEKEAELNIAEAEATASRLKEMSKNMIAADIERAKVLLQQEVVVRAIDNSKAYFSSSEATDESRLKYVSDNISKVGA